MAEPRVEFPSITPIKIINHEGPSVPMSARKEGASGSLYEPLVLLSSGYDYERIGEVMGIRPMDVKNRLGLMRANLGVGSNRAALEKLLARGSLTLDSVLPERFNPDIFARVSDPQDRKIISSLLMGADYPEIAFALRIPAADIEKRVSAIRRSIGAGNNFQIFVFGLGATNARKEEARSSGIQKPEINIFEPVRSGESNSEVAEGVLTSLQQQVLDLYVRGEKEEDIQRKLGLAKRHDVRRELRGLSVRLGKPKSSLAAIGAASEKGIIDLASVVPKDFDPKVFDSLDEVERRIVDGLTYHSQEGDIATKLDLSADEYDAKLTEIRKKVGAKRSAQLVTFYLRAQEMKENKES